MDKDNDKDNNKEPKRKSTRPTAKQIQEPLKRPPEILPISSFDVTGIIRVQAPAEAVAGRIVSDLLASPRYVSPIDGSVNSLPPGVSVGAISELRVEPATEPEPPGNGETLTAKEKREKKEEKEEEKEKKATTKSRRD